MAKASAADFLVEIGTEELPPKALRKLMNAFASGIARSLDDSRLGHKGVTAYASPRRLAVVVADLALMQEDRETQQKGPPVSIAIDDDGNPTKAGLAFAKKCGVEFANLSREQSKKGEWLRHSAIEQGQTAESLLPEIVTQSLNDLPIPRRMRWGDRDTEFVRPVHWLLMLHGKNTVPGSVLGVQSGNTSRGHRFHAPGAIKITEPGNYLSLLEKKGFVVADFEARREQIVRGIQTEANHANGTVMAGDALVDEVTALTEWPVAMTGNFDKSFLALPKEAIVASLTSHQRYFPVVDAKGELLPAFIFVANLESRDPEKVRNGNERVIQPRLADAVFFWKSDQQSPLGERVGALKGVVYQKGLGSAPTLTGR